VYDYATFSNLPYNGLVAPAFPSAGTGERVWFLSPASSDAATLASTTAVGSLPITNLQDQAPSKRWRSSASVVEAITIDFGYPIAANALALVAHNLSSQGVLRVRGAVTSGAITSAPIVETNWVSAWPLGVKPAEPDWLNYVSLIRFTNDEPMRYWRLDIVDPASTQTYVEAGRLALGRAWQPTYGLSFDTTMTYRSSDLQINSPWNTIYTDARFPARVFDMRFEAHEQRDAFDGAMELQRRRGMAKDVIVSLDPAETTDFHRYTMQGVMTNISAVTRQPLWSNNGPLYQFSIQLQEIIF